MTLEELNRELNSGKSVDLSNILDLAIRDSKTGTNSNKCGYQSKNGKTHINYMSNVAWQEYLDNLKEHRKCFKLEIAGDPPKMASYGSSSQMTYELFKDKANVEFEAQLTGFGKAKLDVYINTDNQDIYVEAKRREIYGDYSTVKASDKYEVVYKDIHKSHNAFVFSSKESTQKDRLNYSFSYNGYAIKHFDIKQLICHFLGISADIIRKNNEKPVRFLYLIFDPNSVEKYIDVRYREEILEVYDETKAEIERIDFSALFNAVFNFQLKNLNKRDIPPPEFEFHFVDHTNYTNYLK